MIPVETASMIIIEKSRAHPKKAAKNEKDCARAYRPCSAVKENDAKKNPTKAINDRNINDRVVTI